MSLYFMISFRWLSAACCPKNILLEDSHFIRQCYYIVRRKTDSTLTFLTTRLHWENWISVESSLKSSTFRPVSQHSSQVEYIQAFEDESQEYASIKEWIFVWMGRLSFGDMDIDRDWYFAKNMRFLHISQRPEACRMPLLNTNSLCFFKNLYNWRKVKILSKIAVKLSISLCTMPEHPFIISSKSLIVHSR